MSEKEYAISRQALLRLQTWLSPAFPVGSFAYSHAIEWAISSGQVVDRENLLDWLDGDLRYGSGRNEAIFFAQAWRSVEDNDLAELVRLSELAAAYRSTFEFAVETTQQAAAYMAMLGHAWPDKMVDWLFHVLKRESIAPSVPIVLGVQTARQQVSLSLALPAFLQSYMGNLVSVGTRLIPLGQTDGQSAIAELEEAILSVAAEAQQATVEDLGSTAFMVDLGSIFHETQQPRLFRT